VTRRPLEEATRGAVGELVKRFRTSNGKIGTRLSGGFRATLHFTFEGTDACARLETFDLHRSLTCLNISGVRKSLRGPKRRKERKPRRANTPLNAWSSVSMKSAIQHLPEGKKL